jgi:hypothetical protein
MGFSPCIGTMAHQGLKPKVLYGLAVARLKPCPDTKRFLKLET